MPGSPHKLFPRFSGYFLPHTGVSLIEIDAGVMRPVFVVVVFLCGSFVHAIDSLPVAILHVLHAGLSKQMSL